MSGNEQPLFGAKEKEQLTAFLQKAKGPVLLHLSDTETTSLPMVEQLVRQIKPALILHTGDMADEFKVGRLPEHREGYLDGIHKLLRVLNEAPCPLWFTPGNNDLPQEIRRTMEEIRGCADESVLRIIPNGGRVEFGKLKLELDHVAIPFASGVDFAMYGHGATDDLRYPLPDDPTEKTIYLNGNFFWTAIDSETGAFLRLPARPPVPAMRIFIARHGQSWTKELVQNNPDLPKADPPISVAGIRQARYLAKEMVRQRFTGKILCSPFTRTLMTAQPTAQALGLPIHLEKEFREIVKSEESLEGFTGLTIKQLQQQFPEIADDPSFPYPWWDPTPERTMEVVHRRVDPLIDRLIDAGEDVLLFGHGASTHAAVQHLLELSGYHFNERFPEPNGMNCALSEFRVCYNKQVRPIQVFGTTHLPGMLITSNAVELFTNE